jgi:hypothetical protein
MDTSRPPEQDAAAIAEALDAIHGKAMEHYRNRNLAEYMQVFASDVRYRQFNGVEIGKEQLTRDVKAQLSRITSSDSSYTRESLSIAGDQVIEQLVQIASAKVRVFVFFHRTWQVRRTGRWTWAKTSTGWKIQRVEVLDERITAGAD